MTGRLNWGWVPEAGPVKDDGAPIGTTLNWGWAPAADAPPAPTTTPPPAPAPAPTLTPVSPPPAPPQESDELARRLAALETRQADLDRRQAELDQRQAELDRRQAQLETLAISPASPASPLPQAAPDPTIELVSEVPEMVPTLRVRDLHLAMRDHDRLVPILRGVSFTVGAGEVHGLVGESGAGKTMVAKAILGILPGSAEVTQGEVEFDGTEILSLTARRRAALMGAGIAMIPQDPMTSLNPGYRIGRQISDVLRLHLGMSKAAATERAAALLHEVHIREPKRVMRQFPHQLSGGMRQRVLIAIAFACRPKLIIADEPTTALDVTVQRRVLRLIRELQRNAGTAILFVTHDLGVVAKICDRVSVIHSGRILEQASTAEVIAAPRHAYTRALLAATPRYDRPTSALLPVPNSLTDRLRLETSHYDRRRDAHDA